MILELPSPESGGLAKVEKISKEITQHFQEEIKHKKDIIEEERKIDNIELELKEKEYELYKQINLNVNSKERGLNLKQKELRMSIKKLTDSIESHKVSLDHKQVQMNILMKKREELQSLINKYSAEPLGGSLNLTYQYYIVLLDNLTLEQKKHQNVNNLKYKEVRMNKLIDQVRLRDDYINNINTEMKKKNFKVNPVSEIKGLDDLNIEHSFILPSVETRGRQMPNQQQQIPLQQINMNNNVRTYPNNFKTNQRSQSPRNGHLNYEGYNNPNIIKEKKNFKTKTTEIIDKVKKNELTDLKLNVINDLYPNSKVYYMNSNHPNRGLSQSRMKNVISFNAQNLYQPAGNDRINMSATSIKSTEISQRSMSRGRMEREIDKKVKNILRKNIVGRYKKSPYLKNLINV
jgi:hypothetical protein